MPQAFVVLSVDPEAMNGIGDDIMSKACLPQVYHTHREKYDVLVKLTAGSKQDLQDAIISIEALDGVRSTVTMHVIQRSKRRLLQI